MHISLRRHAAKLLAVGLTLANTGGWQNWQTIPANITRVTGVHNVYITFTSGQPSDYVNLNWLTFGH